MTRSDRSLRRTGPPLVAALIALTYTAGAPGAHVDANQSDSLSVFDLPPLALHTVQEEEPPTDPPLPPLYSHTVQEDEAEHARTAPTRDADDFINGLFSRPSVVDALAPTPDSSVADAERLDLHAVPVPTGRSDWVPGFDSSFSMPLEDGVFQLAPPPSAIPAPGALSLLALGLVALARRRRSASDV